MPKSRKPVVVVSKCLGFAACRYDGAMIRDEFVEKLWPCVRFMPVCPEMEIGLGAPRGEIRIVVSEGKRRLVQPATGGDLTRRMVRFAERRLKSLRRVDGFILKARSPSCGIRDVKFFAGPDEERPIGKGAGFFAEAVMKRFPGLPVEDEKRLASAALQRRFLRRLKPRMNPPSSHTPGLRRAGTDERG